MLLINKRRGICFYHRRHTGTIHSYIETPTLIGMVILCRYPAEASQLSATTIETGETIDEISSQAMRNLLQQPIFALCTKSEFSYSQFTNQTRVRLWPPQSRDSNKNFRKLCLRRHSAYACKPRNCRSRRESSIQQTTTANKCPLKNIISRYQNASDRRQRNSRDCIHLSRNFRSYEIFCSAISSKFATIEQNFAAILRQQRQSKTKHFVYHIFCHARMKSCMKCNENWYFFGPEHDTFEMENRIPSHFMTCH